MGRIGSLRLARSAEGRFDMVEWSWQYIGEDCSLSFREGSEEIYRVRTHRTRREEEHRCVGRDGGAYSLQWMLFRRRSFTVTRDGRCIDVPVKVIAPWYRPDVIFGITSIELEFEGVVHHIGCATSTSGYRLHYSLPSAAVTVDLAKKVLTMPTGIEPEAAVVFILMMIKVHDSFD